jgi:hypothetical protein
VDPDARVASGHVGFVFLLLPLETHQLRLAQALHTLGELGEGLVVGLAQGGRTAGRGRVEDVVHALDGEQQQAGNAIQTPLLVVLVFWLAALFGSFGLFAPRNATVIAVLCVSALSVSGAILLILEMNQPFQQGLVKVSSAPLRYTLAHLGQ